MNAQTSRSSYSRSLRTTRAHFSPIGRGITNSNSSLPRVSSEQARAATSGNIGDHRLAASESVVGQFWTFGLLDRLQAPLTRYHD